ncbi:MAG: hypothetical protein LBI43_04810 [Streptococcaceae bacterium]|nr:hypothetical protein [Streptococcaceae bacterium]
MTYKIWNPAGNITALVDGLIWDLDERKRVNDAIMAEHPEVEQVGFLSELKNSSAELLMAGGEFCGNASRCAAMSLLDGHAGELRLTVADGAAEVACGVSEDGEAWSEIPLDSDKEMRKRLGGAVEVPLLGITHFLVFEEFPENAKEAAWKLIQKLDDGRTLSLGVTWVWGNSILPVVWVRAIDSLFLENACGSGTAALGLYEKLRAGKDVALELLQPSGDKIGVQATDETLRIAGTITLSGSFVV